MKNTFSVNIKNSCHQNWAAMLPSETGKYCSHCSHHVTDFTQMNDGEIAAILKKSKGRLCGRFTNHQMNRPLVLQEERKTWPQLPTFMAGLLFFSAVDKSQAQITIVQHHQAPFSSKGSSSQEALPLVDSSKLTVRGIVMDDESTEPLPGAVISLKGSNIIAFSDTNGAFQLVIPNDTLLAVYYLEVKYLGFVSRTIEVLNDTLHYNPLKEMTIKLKTDTEMVVTTGFVITEKIQKKRWWKPNK